MIFGIRCWRAGWIPCDADLSVEAVSVVGVALAAAVIALGLFALIGVLATKGKG